MVGKQVISRADYLQKIAAAVETRGDRDFFIVARTDALAVEGVDEAVVRMEAAHSAGADATFIEAPQSIDQLSEVGRRAPKPTVCNMVERGRTPLLSHTELAGLGFELILYPLTGLYAAAKALEVAYGQLREDGTTARRQSDMMDFTDFNELMGVTDTLDWMARLDEEP
jgi:methylisocitrate lyase